MSLFSRPYPLPETPLERWSHTRTCFFGRRTMAKLSQKLGVQAARRAFMAFRIRLKCEVSVDSGEARRADKSPKSLRADHCRGRLARHWKGGFSVGYQPHFNYSFRNRIGRYFVPQTNSPCLPLLAYPYWLCGSSFLKPAMTAISTGRTRLSEVRDKLTTCFVELSDQLADK